MKKTLDTTSIMNELRGQSVFFPTKEAATKLDAPTATPPVESQPENTRKRVLQNKQESLQASNHASLQAGEVDLKVIHKTLKAIGKEVLYMRLTQEEKNQVSDIEYTYYRQGIKTSGNEIGRIGLNYLLSDYKANGEHSILAKLLTELHT